MTYLRYLFGTSFLLLASAATLNFFIDPGHIYREGYVDPIAYARKLFTVKTGLYLPDDGINERILARYFLQFSPKTDCVVVGSSHVMQISNKRQPPALTQICQSLLNLGVSGAGIEDEVVLGYLSAKKRIAKKIVIGVDPWTFAFGKDERWSIYNKEYLAAKVEIAGGDNIAVVTANNESSLKPLFQNLAKYKNLINMEYTLRSGSTLVDYLKNGFPSYSETGTFDSSSGGVHSARLVDGSLVYSAAYIRQSKVTVIPVGGASYKTDGDLNQEDAIRLYKNFLVWLMQQGIEPVLLMTPYHQNVWQAEQSVNTIAMRKTEKIVMSIAAELNIRVAGSYDPETVGCKGSEFYDFMHATPECLAKIRIR